MYRNSERYADPTAGAAIGKVMNEYRTQQREKQKVVSRPKVYVISRYAGDVDANIKNAVKFCRFVIEKKCVPVAGHLLYPAILDDAISEQRKLGCQFGLALLSVCDEVWCFGKKRSAGMIAEIREATLQNKPIRYFDEALNEINDR